MKSLLIDTATSNVTVSISENSNILSEYHNNISSDIASKIITIVDDCLINSNLKIEDIDKIYVVNGPGSFTGIRVGVTIAKTIAWSLKKDIIPLSSLELLATTHTNKKYIVPMIDARRDNVFAGIYDKELNCIKKDTLINKNDLLCNLDSNYELVSYDNLNLESIIKPNPDIEKIVLKHINDESINPHNLNPNYLKLTEAEENRLKND